MLNYLKSLTLRVIIKIFYALIFPSTYSFNTTSNDRLNNDRFIKDWNFQGNVQVDNGYLLVSNSTNAVLEDTA